MLRKSLLWGLTLVLVVALVSLIIRGRRLEKEQAGRLVEVVQDSKPTQTRALTPQDLEVVQSNMKLEKAADSAKHAVEIRNNGAVPYDNIALKFVYLDRSGKVVTTKNYSVIQTVMPGSTVQIPNISMDGIPAAAAGCRTSIVYADIGHSPAQGQ